MRAPPGFGSSQQWALVEGEDWEGEKEEEGGERRGREDTATKIYQIGQHTAMDLLNLFSIEGNGGNGEETAGSLCRYTVGMMYCRVYTHTEYAHSRPLTYVWSARKYRAVLDAVSSALFLPYGVYVEYAIYAGVRCTTFVSFIWPLTALFLLTAWICMR